MLAVALSPIFTRLHRKVTTPQPAHRSYTPISDSYLEGLAESTTTKYLRLGFGSLWILDGLLQGQPKMAKDFVSQVIAPAASSNPNWLDHIMTSAAQVWVVHPRSADAFSVVVQIAIGILLIVADNRRAIKIAGLMSAGWSLVVWIFGEGLGGVLIPGSGWLTGLPGAALAYLVASLAILHSDDIDTRLLDGRLLRRVERLLGSFWLAEATIQALPFEGFWGNGITSILRSAKRAMPSQLATIQSSAISFTSQHSWSVNFAMVLCMGAIGTGLLTKRYSKLSLILSILFATLTWWFAMGFGILGGLGTDPNIGLPYIFLASILLYVKSGGHSSRSVDRARPEMRPLVDAKMRRISPAGLVLAALSVATVPLGLFLAIPIR